MPNILAIDYGLKRLGIAIADSVLQIPHPLSTIIMTSDIILNINKLIIKWNVVKIVLGIPNANHSNQTSKIRALIKQFQTSLMTVKETVLIDESYSSDYAISQLKQQNAYSQGKKHYIDQLAACAIIDSYFSMNCDV